MTCFWTGLKLGLTSFGGPVAHLGYFRETYVVRKGWVSERRFGELLALCQFLPGPSSSQLGAAIGYHKGGWLGAIGAWLGFTLPSACLMIALASGLDSLTHYVGTGWIQGLKLAAVAVITLAVIGMKKKLCVSRLEKLLALLCLLLLVVVPSAWMQPLVIVLGGIVGWAWLGKQMHESGEEAERGRANIPVWSVLGVMVFLMGLLALPLLGHWGRDGSIIAGLLQSGSWVFGGGHVVLPLLESSFVNDPVVGMSQDTFLAGYGAAQAVPGPMFTLASYLGAIVGLGGNPVLGGVIGTCLIFAPGMYLLAVGLPLWDWLKRYPRAQGAVRGASAAVVGLLASALMMLLRKGTIGSGVDLLFVVLVLLVMGTRVIPVWLGVLVSGVLGALIW